MANHQLLDNITHKDTRVITAHHPKFGDNQSYTRIVMDELKQAQSTYPLFFRKNAETGQFEIIAMFGLGDSENLFLDENGWHAHYIPLTIQRRPFLIGFQTDNSGNENPVVHIDMDSPRVSDTDGEALFLAQGGQSPYLQHISSVLNTIHEGTKKTQPFVNMLQAHQLIEPVSLKITLKDGNTIEVGGLYTINEELVQDLRGDVIIELHEQGYMEAIYMMLASLQNVTRIIELKNKTL
ncbi:MAG: SapC family protein [Aestuariibacter sp.]